MSIEAIKKELGDATIIINNLLNAIIGLMSEIAPPVVVPPVVVPPVVVPPAAPTQLIMTALAGGATYQQYIDAGHTDETMIAGGFATAPVVVAAPIVVPPVVIPPVVGAITPEQLNAMLVVEFNRLGSREPIDAAFKELGFTAVTDLPAASYQTLIDKVKALVKAV